jgi:hypothetical protein
MKSQSWFVTPTIAAVPHRRPLSLLVLAGVLLCWASVVSPLQAQNAVLPFKGKQDGQFSFTPMTLEAGRKTVQIIATGPVSQFGMSRTVILGDVDLDAELRPTPLPPGSWTLTAANGDRVEGEFVWRGTPTGTFGVFTLTGTYRITSGTGRFHNATGGGTGTGHLNAVSGATNFSWNGTLVLPVRRHR